MAVMTLIALENDCDRRLDRVLRKALDKLPLSAIHRLLRKGQILVNGQVASPDQRIKTGDCIEIPVLEDDHSDLIQITQTGKSKNDLPPIIYEGNGLLVVNKPSGIPVHGKDSLLSRLEPYLEKRVSPSLSFKPGPLHRLDTQTSGLITYSLNLEGARYMSAMLRERRIRKFYLAIVEGHIYKNQVWKDELVRNKSQKKTLPAQKADCGKVAQSRAVPLAQSKAGYSLLLIETSSGRTHQIRSQAAHRGHPLAGDTKYGGKKTGDGFFLHALMLCFPYDSHIKMPKELIAPPPLTFQKKIHSLFNFEYTEIDFGAIY